MSRLLLLGVTLLAGAAAAPSAPEPITEPLVDSCVVCHRRAETVKAFPVWAQDQFLHWYGAVHGREGVGCSACHGGDPAVADKDVAHRGVLPSSDKASPVYYKNLPETCAACHAQVVKQFSESGHYHELKADRLAPTCTTCHGFQMDMQAVTPLELAGRCTLCHNAERGTKPAVVGQAQAALAHLARTRHAIERAQVAVDLAREQGRTPDEAVRLLDGARLDISRTSEFWHRFRLGAFERELTRIEGVANEAYAQAATVLMGRPPAGPERVGGKGE